ncbi:MAG: hypothetical protein KJZ75_11535 [Hyphomonadaceae bacterium]|nr:hypothetical protein [Hyphomonadaceae bacterium]
MTFDLSHIPDYTTKEGAEALIEKIKEGLQRKGLPVPQLKAVFAAGSAAATSSTLMKPRYDVRSDMVNGFPKEMIQRSRAP